MKIACIAIAIGKFHQQNVHIESHISWGVTDNQKIANPPSKIQIEKTAFSGISCFVFIRNTILVNK